MLNQLNIIGRVTNDPTIRTVSTVQGDRDVCNLNVAVNEFYRGSKKTTFFRASLWGFLASRAMKSIKKGSLVHITGRVRVSQYTNTNSELSVSLEISASDFSVLTGWKSEDYNNSVQDLGIKKPSQNEELTIDLDNPALKESSVTEGFNFRDQIKNIVKANSTSAQVSPTGINKYHADNETHKEQGEIAKKDINTEEGDHE